MAANMPLYKRLWAPWRLAYIQDANAPGDHECFLCRYRDSDADQENGVVVRGDHSFVVLNRFPYNNGHLLVAPLAHKATFQEMEDEELLCTLQQLRRITAVLERVLFPDGFNIGVNLGKVAGAGLPGHFHWHVVPRWNGDTNFMPVLADTHVIPQSLAALQELILSEIAKE